MGHLHSQCRAMQAAVSGATTSMTTCSTITTRCSQDSSSCPRPCPRCRGSRSSRSHSRVTRRGCRTIPPIKGSRCMCMRNRCTLGGTGSCTNTLLNMGASILTASLRTSLTMESSLSRPCNSRRLAQARFQRGLLRTEKISPKACSHSTMLSETTLVAPF